MTTSTAIPRRSSRSHFSPPAPSPCPQPRRRRGQAAAKPAATAAVKSAPAAPKKPELIIPDAYPEQVKAAEMVYYGKYECEFNQTVDIAQSPKHSSYVTVRHGKGEWLMKPVLSSTGAIRLEDVRGETLMVQIASKSMLLNTMTARRIVDECISPKQRELIEAAEGRQGRVRRS
jgi:hypothetical protein